MRESLAVDQSFPMFRLLQDRARTVAKVLVAKRPIPRLPTRSSAVGRSCRTYRIRLRRISGAELRRLVNDLTIIVPRGVAVQR